MFYSILFIFSDACTLRLFGKILSFSNSHFSTNFRRTFDRFTFDELSFDVISTNGRVRRNVIFDDMSHSTKGFSTKSHGRSYVCAKIFVMVIHIVKPSQEKSVFQGELTVQT